MGSASLLKLEGRFPVVISLEPMQRLGLESTVDLRSLSRNRLDEWMDRVCDELLAGGARVEALFRRSFPARIGGLENAT